MKTWILALAALGVFALAQATLRLTINGTASATPAITVNGKVYVPLESLQKAGMGVSRSGANLSLNFQVAAGGTNQRASLEGCLGETLFNGIWRIKVSNLQAIKKDGTTPGWGMTVELRNGSKNTLTLTDTGVDGTGQGIQIVSPNGNTIPVDPYDVQKLTFASLPQGGVFTHQLKFYYPFGTTDDQVQKPDKMLLEIKPEGIGASLRDGGLRYSVPNPSLRVKLDCQK